jgi:hypothetical protein
LCAGITIETNGEEKSHVGQVRVSSMNYLTGHRQKTECATIHGAPDSLPALAKKYRDPSQVMETRLADASLQFTSGLRRVLTNHTRTGKTVNVNPTKIHFGCVI